MWKGWEGSGAVLTGLNHWVRFTQDFALGFRIVGPLGLFAARIPSGLKNNLRLFIFHA